jgi:hypothetical protein
MDTQEAKNEQVNPHIGVHIPSKYMRTQESVGVYSGKANKDPIQSISNARGSKRRQQS